MSFKRNSKDKKYRQLFWRLEISKNFLRAIVRNVFLPKEKRIQAQNLLQEISKLKTNRIRNRCLISARGRSISRTFKLNRMQIYMGAGVGSLPGVRKSSW